MGYGDCYEVSVTFFIMLSQHYFALSKLALGGVDGICVNTAGSYKCDCKQGFKGRRCEVNINECESNPCQNEGTCIDERGGFRCICMPGKTLN